MAYDLNRRTALKGMLNGAGVVVGVPLLNAFLDGNGEALAATGAAKAVGRPYAFRSTTSPWASSSAAQRSAERCSSYASSGSADSACEISMNS